MQSASVDGSFIEHVLEHIGLDDVFHLLDECRRVLRPGGVMRVSVPDFRKYAESYLGDPSFLEELRPRRPTRLLAVDEVIHRHGHRSVWDAPTMVSALAAADFVDPQESAFHRSKLPNIPDAPCVHRKAATSRRVADRRAAQTCDGRSPLA